ncbi:MAG: hypothetical protein QOG65_3273 [Actinomycetota bacterium]|nr:hypothetical protein [Actinomycetota bacterium]
MPERAECQDGRVCAMVTFLQRFCGPPDSANGGYTAGTLAEFVHGPAEVTLRRAPPLDRPLTVDRVGDLVRLLDGEELIADASATTVDIETPAAVDFARAQAATLSSPMRDRDRHPFPTCFACGPDRHESDGLRLFAGRVPGTDLFATTWTPTETAAPIIWAALDCPSSALIYLDDDAPPPHVLGRIAARIDREPAPGTPHVIMSWLLGRDGRKMFSASAIYDADARVCAVARATWIQLKPSPDT